MSSSNGIEDTIVLDRIPEAGIRGEKILSSLSRRVQSVILNGILGLFSITCIFPLVWLFYSSLKLKRNFNSNIIGLPKEPTFENYIRIMTNPDYHIWSSMVNSARNTVMSVALIIFFGFIVGYILARIRFRGNFLIKVMFLLGLVIPVYSLMVPIYVLFSRAGLSNKWFTLVIPYLAFGLPIAIFLVDGYIRAVPKELEEAAAIDGSSFTRTLFQIIMPLSTPILVTIGIIQTFSCWNEFVFALLLLKRQSIQTVPLAMTQFTGQFSSDYPKIMAALLLTMSPIIVFYFVFSRQIIKGMVSGAVKG
ncbi:MAG: carbohydrate ABC transporter permease [Spirochaetales bacterium]|nr:carbohydrate ABC transporter permease [Spirochaetales bacterium]